MANKGIIYEENVNKDLFKYKAMYPYFKGAGPDSNAPDAWIKQLGKPYKVEVKLDMKVDFGQGSLDYDMDKQLWTISKKNVTPSGKFMQAFLEQMEVPAIVNREWGQFGPPRKFSMKDCLDQFTKEDVAYDYKYFTDRFVSLPANAIANYYNSKDTYYMHIGGEGLYYMGRDPAKLGVNPLPLNLRLRIRLKRGGSQPIHNYRFTTAIQSTGKPPATEKSLDNITYLKALGARSHPAGKKWR